MNEIIEQLHTLKREELKFISSHIDMIQNLDECVMIISGSYSAKSKDECMTRIRNIDLWIDANKLQHPGLTGFRLEVRKKMKELGVELWPDYVYRDSNHYKKRT